MIWETLGKQIAIMPPTTFTNFILSQNLIYNNELLYNIVIKTNSDSESGPSPYKYIK